MRRPLLLLLAALLVLATGAAPASAADSTVTRTWTASLGKDGTNGKGILRAYMAGIGTLDLNVKALQRSVTYSVQIRGGTCSSLGTILARPASFRTSTVGTFAGLRPLTTSQMNNVWKVAKTKPIVLRIVAGTHVRCATLNFPRATRVAIGAYSINLPVIPGPAGYPPCGVAMYMKPLWQPREPGVTLIYAHARRGMFLPLLNASKINNGASLIGKTVKVYTSDSRVHTYQITRVRRHVTSIQNAAGITTEKLWLYTSEGPNFTYPKLVVEAKRVSTTTTTYGASHPRANPYAC